MPKKSGKLSRQNSSTGGAAAANTGNTSLSSESYSSWCTRVVDEVESLSAIFPDDFTGIQCDPQVGPMHFQLRVKPLQNEPDDSGKNHCAALLDVVMAATDRMPILVVTRGTIGSSNNSGSSASSTVNASGGLLSDSVLDELCVAVRGEASRLLSSKDDNSESLVFQLMSFMSDYLLPYNHPQKNFHEQMIERENNAERDKVKARHKEDDEAEAMKREREGTTKKIN